MKTKILLTLMCLFWQALVWGQATLVKDIYPLSDGGGISSMASVGDKLIFNANNSVNGNELWISDGTEAGTFMLKDINIGDRSKSSSPGTFRQYNNLVTFIANDGKGGDYTEQTAQIKELFKFGIGIISQIGHTSIMILL